MHHNSLLKKNKDDSQDWINEFEKFNLVRCKIRNFFFSKNSNYFGRHLGRNFFGSSRFRIIRKIMHLEFCQLEAPSYSFSSTIPSPVLRRMRDLSWWDPKGKKYLPVKGQLELESTKNNQLLHIWGFWVIQDDTTHGNPQWKVTLSSGPIDGPKNLDSSIKTASAKLQKEHLWW